MATQHHAGGTAPRFVCTLDVETRSPVNLVKTGPYPYAEHPDTDLWCVCWAIGDGPVLDWRPGDPVPPSITEHMARGGWFEFHNAGFEHAIWSRILAPRYGWPELPLEQISDTMIRACVMGLPRSLEDAGRVMKLDVQKDKDGHRLMMRMAKPRAPRKDEHPDGLLWWDEPEKVKRLTEYCRQDVRAQRELGRTLRPLSSDERRNFLRTLRANVTGIRIDRNLVDKSLRILAHEAERHTAQLKALTNGQVTGPTKVADLKTWLAGQGVVLESLDKNIVAELIEDGQIPDHVLPVLDIRAQGGKSSVSKFPAFEAHRCADDRIRYEFIHHGAGKTGRFAGSGVQLQNLPSRGGLKWDDALSVVDIVGSRSAAAATDLIEILYTNATTALSSCLRSVLMASSGHTLYCADYSNIEGRKAAWIGSEQWKLDAFRAFDDGHGPDLYLVAAGGILGCAPEDVSPVMRNAVGKVSELALQFGGGVGAFLSMAKTYRVEIADYWDVIQRSLSTDVLDRAHEAWDARGVKSGIDATTWLAAESVKVAWRDRHPGIVQCWHDCERAAIAALEAPGSAHMVASARIAFQARRISGVPFLLQRLPSGRLLYLAYPFLEEKPTPWGSTRKQINYFGVPPQTKRKAGGGGWQQLSTYGGDLFQSAVQGSARDVMMQGWANLEDDGGYSMLLNVHDELAGEHRHGDLREFETLMCALPDWAAGLPVRAEGYAAQRYRKN